MKRFDILLVAAILVVAGICYIYYTHHAAPGAYAVITVEDTVVKKLPLDKDTTYTVQTQAGYNIVTIQDGFADVTEADCRDSVCVESKRISKTGETIVCLPHKMVVSIEGDTEQEIDAVVG